MTKSRTVHPDVTRSTVYRAIRRNVSESTDAGAPCKSGPLTDPDLPIPASYPEFSEDLKHTLANARWRAQRVVDTELLALCWLLDTQS